METFWICPKCFAQVTVRRSHCHLCKCIRPGKPPLAITRCNRCDRPTKVCECTGEQFTGETWLDNIQVKR